MAWRSSFVPEILLFGLWLCLHQCGIRVSGHMWVLARGEGTLEPWVWAGRATVQDIRGQAEFDGYYYNQFLVVIIYIASDPLSFGLLLWIVYLFACGIYALCSRSSSIIEYYSRYFLQFFSQWIAHLQLLKTFLFFKRDECLHFGI